MIFMSMVGLDTKLLSQSLFTDPEVFVTTFYIIPVMLFFIEPNFSTVFIGTLVAVGLPSCPVPENKHKIHL